jgi:hypothetical protein
MTSPHLCSLRWMKYDVSLNWARQLSLGMCIWEPISFHIHPWSRLVASHRSRIFDLICEIWVQ